MKPSFSAYANFMPAFAAARQAAIAEIGQRWDLHPEAYVWARLPAAWVRVRVMGRKQPSGRVEPTDERPRDVPQLVKLSDEQVGSRWSCAPRDQKLPVARFWPGGRLPVGPEYTMPPPFRRRGRDWRQDAALTPQPSRNGPDDWTTPPCLCSALTHDVLPMLPAGPVWEPAPGSGALVEAINAAGRYVVTSDNTDFRDCTVPPDSRILATNPPFHLHSAFIARGLDLLDTGQLDAVVLLFRHDHLQSESRTLPHCRIAALNRATQVLICPWRPVWIAGTSGNGRWSNAWVAWIRGAEPRPPVWLERRTAGRTPVVSVSA